MKKNFFLMLMVGAIVFMASCSDDIMSFHQSDSDSQTKSSLMGEKNQVQAIELSQKLNESFAISPTRALTPIYPDFYGGMFINDDGILTILVVGDTIEYKNNFTQRMQSNNYILQRCQYSYATLKNIMDQLNEFVLNPNNVVVVNDLKIEGFCIVDQNNHIAIQIQNCTEEKVARFKDLVMNSPALVFENSNGEAKLQGDIEPGRKINNRVYAGTIGYRARTMGNEEGIVSSGHVFSSGDRVYDDYGNQIGECINSASGFDIDAAFIKTNSSYYPSSSTAFLRAFIQPYPSDFPVNTEVTMEGAGSSGANYGKVYSTNATGSFPFAGGSIYLVNMVSCTYPSVDGDSGALVYSTYGSHYIGGIHMGRASNKAYYTPATRINMRFNLTSY